MIISSSQVSYKLDKEFYRGGETPILMLEKKGYMLKPEVESITYGNLKTDVTLDIKASAVEIDPIKAAQNGGYILVTYHSQIKPFIKKLFTKKLYIKIPFVAKSKN